MTKADRLAKIARRARQRERQERSRSMYARYLGADIGALSERFDEHASVREAIDRIVNDRTYAAASLWFSSSNVKPFWRGRW